MCLATSRESDARNGSRPRRFCAGGARRLATSTHRLRGSFFRAAVAGFVGSDRVGAVPTEYRPLLELCRLLAESLTVGQCGGTDARTEFFARFGGRFRASRHARHRRSFRASRSYRVAVQGTHTVNQPVADQPDVTMRPDLTIERDGRPCWSSMPSGSVAGSPEPADLYQVMAYGTALGAEGVVLVYPGKRWQPHEYRFTHTPLRLMTCTLQVRGTRAACVRSVRRLAQLVLKRASSKHKRRDS